MSFILSWVLPILIGAVIGFVTNDIAIKMLFRPLREIRLFGIRLPFTPGILPKNRHKLALSLGNTVSRELLNEDVLAKRFNAPDFQVSVHAQVESFLGIVLDSKLGGLRFSSGSPLYEKLSLIISSLLENILGSEGFEEGARSLLTRVLDGLGSISVETLLAGRDSESVARSLLDFVLSAQMREKTLARLEGGIDTWAAGEASLGSLLPLNLAESAERIVHAIYPEAFRIFLDFLRSPAMKRELAENGRVIVADLLKRLNTVQRFFVAAAQYDKTIMADMDKTIADLLASLERVGAKEETRQLLARQAGEGLGAWAGLKPAEIEARIPAFRERILSALGRFAAAAAEEGGRERLALAVAAVVDGMRGKSLEDAAREAIGMHRKDLAGFLAGFVRSALESERGSHALARGISTLIAEFLEGHRDESLASLLSLSPATREELCLGLRDKALEIIRDKTSDILQTIDVKRTVVDKIDSLDMEAVEKIVLDVMREQFAWINLFGAVLGGIIGLVQALLAALL